jgi:hypothetical protein
LDAQGMDVESSQQSDGFTPLEGDALFHVFGPEQNGRIRGMGFGVTPTMFKKSNLDILRENEQVKEKNKILSDKVEGLSKDVAELRNIISKYMSVNPDGQVW